MTLALVEAGQAFIYSFLLHGDRRSMGIDGKWDKGLAMTPFQDYLERQYLIYYSYLIVKCIYIVQSASYLRGNQSYNVAMTMSHIVG